MSSLPLYHFQHTSIPTKRDLRYSQVVEPALWHHDRPNSWFMADTAEHCDVISTPAHSLGCQCH